MKKSVKLVRHRRLAALLMIVVSLSLAGCPTVPRATGGLSSERRDPQARSDFERQARDLALDAELLDQAALSETLRIVADAIARRQEGELAEACRQFAARHLKGAADGEAESSPQTARPGPAPANPFAAGGADRRSRKTTTARETVPRPRPKPPRRKPNCAHIMLLQTAPTFFNMVGRSQRMGGA